ncbi:MAG: hypothetical protein H6662_10630 [Ardenticatenaceae bacterium]|nr:hypothetical protein [Anaerolineales bacterium]MCB8922030.1 hypothetical protein [Ardenticatenaceae bacterium]MCB8989606.1 hypothetical protein [Ardenticatenaceae bacterium]MCB9003149.1 hypothetical protein [Ardenticatenaceae bacterium]
MTESIQPTTKLPRLRMFRDNPVTMKELRSRMRGRRAFVVLTIYLGVMSLLITLIYLAYASSSNQPYGPDPRQAGKVVFAAVVGVEVLLAIFIAPAFTAGAITGEKERQTFDLLRTTLLPANWFVMGKLQSALGYVLLLIVASIPLQSIAFLLGGLSWEELVVSQIIIVIAAVTFAIFGLFCSASLRSTLAASVATFGGAIFFTLGLPVIFLLMTGFLGPLFFTTSTLSWVAEAALAYGAFVLMAFNLPATLIASEVFLLEENTLFFFKQNFGGHQFWFFSPWLLFVVIYLLLARLFYWLTVRRVRRVAKS